MKGVLDENETKTCDALKSDKDKLLNRLKVEVSLISGTYVYRSET